MICEFNSSKEFKAKKLKEYFTSKNRIDVTDLNYRNAIKLDKMISIFYSDDEELEKYCQMKEEFKDSKEFYKNYKYLQEFVDDNLIKYIYGYVTVIANYLENIEQNVSKEDEKELIELGKYNYFEDYPYAKYFVMEYIDYNDSPYLQKFLLEKGLYEKDFNNFLTIISKVDKSLYDQYLTKEKENKMLRQLETIRKVENIRSGVTTGFTKDGEKFDEVEFFCNLPFYDQESSRLIIDDFGLTRLSKVDQRLRILLENLCSENLNEVLKYIYSKKLVSGNPSIIKEEDIMNTRYIINGQEISNEAKQAMIDYMRERNIPFIQGAFGAVRNKYITEGLTQNKEKKLNK